MKHIYQDNTNLWLWAIIICTLTSFLAGALVGAGILIIFE